MIELDGRVVVDAPLQDVVDGRLGPPFVFPLVANRSQSSGGSYVKVPMPYRRSMRITTEHTTEFFHVAYRRFADPSGVRTFDPSDHARDVLARLRSAGERDPKPDPHDARTERRSLVVPPGGSRPVATLAGPGTIAELALRLDEIVGPVNPPLLIDDGRGFKGGASEFTVRVDPRNKGVRLTRRLDSYWANAQEAVVFVDGAEAGRWTQVPTTLGPRWVDVSLDLPAALTEGRSSISVRTVPTPTSLPGFQDFTYTVDSRVDGSLVRTDTVDVGPDSTADETAHGYQIEGQTWEGTTRTRYPPQGDRDAIAASDRVLEDLRLRISFDGVATVDAPVGEFFGSGLGEYPVRALMFAMDPEANGWYSAWWPMPYARSAVVELVNSADRPVTVDTRLRWRPVPGNASGLAEHGDLGYFHATSRRGEVQSGRDWVLLDTQGRGKVVGVSQTMRGRRFDSLTQRGYLEGDERAYVDGARTPALHGTGTEDFYEGGWYFAFHTFSNPQNGNPAFELEELGCEVLCDSVTGRCWPMRWCSSRRCGSASSTARPTSGRRPTVRPRTGTGGTGPAGSVRTRSTSAIRLRRPHTATGTRAAPTGRC